MAGRSARPSIGGWSLLVTLLLLVTTLALAVKGAGESDPITCSVASLMHSAPSLLG